LSGSWSKFQKWRAVWTGHDRILRPPLQPPRVPEFHPASDALAVLGWPHALASKGDRRGWSAGPCPLLGSRDLGAALIRLAALALRASPRGDEKHHFSLMLMPAMAAGVTDHVWDCRRDRRGCGTGPGKARAVQKAGDWNDAT